MRRSGLFLWIVLAVLVMVDGVMFVAWKQANSRLEVLAGESHTARGKYIYAAEEERLVHSAKVVPPSFPLLAGQHPQGVQFHLIVSVDDCLNCIEDEVTALNDLASDSQKLMTDGVRGHWVRNASEDRVAAISEYLPSPHFRFQATDDMSLVEGSYTPLVLVVRTADRRILDAHMPIPEDHSKRRAFYERWQTLLLVHPLAEDG